MLDHIHQLLVLWGVWQGDDAMPRTTYPFKAPYVIVKSEGELRRYDADTCLLLDQIIAKLPRRQKRVVVVYYTRDVGYKEAAKQLHTSARQVQALLAAAHEIINREIGRGEQYCKPA